MDEREETAADDSRPAFKPPRNVLPPSHRALQEVANRHASHYGMAPTECNAGSPSWLLVGRSAGCPMTQGSRCS